MGTNTDPVCGMKVGDLSGAPQSAYRGATYYFCCEGCKVKFDANPQQYAGKTAAR